MYVACCVLVLPALLALQLPSPVVLVLDALPGGVGLVHLDLWPPGEVGGGAGGVEEDKDARAVGAGVGAGHVVVRVVQVDPGLL